jgi:predicted dehydrogenase/nucleoside-diphosphate-sugar epimerase
MLETDTVTQAVRQPLASTAPVRLALIGCGAIAESLHLPVLAGHEGLRLVALVDRAVDRARRLADGYGVPAVLDDAEKLKADEVDAAIIATPARHHAACAISLMRRGIHVLVEKPMATSVEEAEEMLRVSRETNTRLAAGYFRRLYPALRLMKSLIDSGFLGRTLRFHAEGGGMYSWAAATLANVRRDLAGGGVLIDYGSHIIDLLFYLFDEPFEVEAYRDNNLGGVEADCVIAARLSHKGSAIAGRVELARTRNVGNFVRVECEHGALTFEVNDRFRVRVVPREGSVVDSLRGVTREYHLEARWSDQQEDESWFETFRTQIDDWLDAIRDEREPALSGHSAMPTVRLIDRCYERPEPMPEPWVTEGLGERPKAAAAARTVLLTGATGFIGTRVAEVLALRDGWNVRALVHNPGNAARLARLPVELVQSDLGDEAAVRRLVAGCQAVVHCAIGTAWGQRREIFKVTVDGTRALAEAALEAGAGRFVHLSTISVHGDDSTMTGRLDELTPVAPVKGSDYGESKALAERVVLDAAQRGLSAVIFRPARVYGPFSRIFIERPLAAMARRSFQWLADPHVPADMVYVDSVVHAIVLSLEAPPERVRGEVFTVSDGDPISWYDFYRSLAEPLGLDIDEVRIVSRGARAERRSGLIAGVRAVVTSPEFKKLGRKVLDTDPLGTVPRWTLERLPATERLLRRMVGADDSLPLYRREPRSPIDVVEMGSGGALANIDKLRRVLGFERPVGRDRAMALTLEWVRHARVV